MVSLLPAYYCAIPSFYCKTVKLRRLGDWEREFYSDENDDDDIHSVCYVDDTPSQAIQTTLRKNANQNAYRQLKSKAHASGISWMIADRKCIHIQRSRVKSLLLLLLGNTDYQQDVIIAF